MVALSTLLLIILAVVGSVGLFGTLGYLVVRVRRLASRPSGQVPPGLEEELRTFQEELARTRQELAGLSERVEFTERLLEGRAATTVESDKR